MEYQEEIHGDKKFVGNVEILGSLNSKDISVLRNKISQSRSESQSIKATFTKFYETIITDGIADVSEKRVLLQKWNEIEAEYPIVRQRALDRGISELDEQMVDYADAYTALNTYLFGASGILDDMTVETTITPAEMDLAFSTYYTERETVLSLTFTISEENVVIEAIAGTPRFRGSFLYVDDAGATTYYSTAVPGDWVVLKSGTALLCGIYQWSGTSWIKKTGSWITEEMIATTALSILAAVDEGYGTSTDYLSLSSTALEIIIARRIFAKQIVLTAEGYLKSHDYAENIDGYPTAGFMLDVANQVIKAYGGVFNNIIIKNSSIDEVDALVSNLGDMAYKGAVTKNDLDSTIISGGTIVSNLLSANTIKALTGLFDNIAITNANIRMTSDGFEIVSRAGAFDAPQQYDSKIAIKLYYSQPQIQFHMGAANGTWQNYGSLIGGGSPGSFYLTVNCGTSASSTTINGLSNNTEVNAARVLSIGPVVNAPASNYASTNMIVQKSPGSGWGSFRFYDIYKGAWIAPASLGFSTGW